jgi:hypothetical protein
MRLAACAIASVVALAALGAPTHAQAGKPATPESLVGEYNGTLTLDTGQRPVTMLFRMSGGALACTVTADNDTLGEAEKLSLRGDTIFFKVDRFEFTGIVIGPRIRFSMLMWNGVTRRELLMARRPEIPAPKPERAGAG